MVILLYIVHVHVHVHVHCVSSLFFNVLSAPTVPLLVSLPTSEEELFSSHTPKYADHAPFLPSGVNQPSSPLSIVLYVMCNNNREYFQLMHTFSEILTSEEMPAAVRDRFVVQVCQSSSSHML